MPTPKLSEVTQLSWRKLSWVTPQDTIGDYFRHCDTIHQHLYGFRIKAVVEQDHSKIWKLIDKLHKENMEERALERSFTQGNDVRKRVRVQTQRLHNRLLNLCQRYQDNNNQQDDFLRGVGRNIRVSRNETPPVMLWFIVARMNCESSWALAFLASGQNWLFISIFTSWGDWLLGLFRFWPRINTD